MAPVLLLSPASSSSGFSFSFCPTLLSTSYIDPRFAPTRNQPSGYTTLKPALPWFWASLFRSSFLVPWDAHWSLTGDDLFALRLGSSEYLFRSTPLRAIWLLHSVRFNSSAVAGSVDTLFHVRPLIENPPSSPSTLAKSREPSVLRPPP